MTFIPVGSWRLKVQIILWFWFVIKRNERFPVLYVKPTKRQPSGFKNQMKPYLDKRAELEEELGAGTRFLWQRHGGREWRRSFTICAIGVAHVVRWAITAVVRVGGSRVDSNVLTPIHLRQTSSTSSPCCLGYQPYSLRPLTFSLVSKLLGSTRLMKLVSVLT